jgi:hypothetical protein
MSMYSIAVFLHIMGALGIFAAIGLDWAGLSNLRRATDTAQVREWVRLLAAPRTVGGPAALLVLVSGIYMSATRWGPQGWILVALGGMVVTAALGGAIGGRRIPAIIRALPAESGPVSIMLRGHLDDPAVAAGQNRAPPRHRVPDVDPAKLGRLARGDGSGPGPGRRIGDAGVRRQPPSGPGGEG